MNRENTEKLFYRFPFFGRDEWKDDPNAVRYTLMPFGFECGDGWFTLIWTLCVYIENAYKNAKMNGADTNVEDFLVIQVKEKFGGLRFYTGGIHKAVAERIFGMISLAEGMSYHICEQCGNAGELRDDRNWRVTLCDVCDNEER